MACISKLVGGFDYDCDSGTTGLTSALIVNKEDIGAIGFVSGTIEITSLTLKAGANAYKIDTPKRTLVVTETLKVNEGAPNAFTHSATLTATGLQIPDFFAKIGSITNGSFVIITLNLTRGARIYGLYYGMSATSVERSSHDNGGRYSITMETPEQFIGEDALILATNVYDSMYAAALG